MLEYLSAERQAIFTVILGLKSATGRTGIIQFKFTGNVQRQSTFAQEGHNYDYDNEIKAQSYRFVTIDW